MGPRRKDDAFVIGDEQIAAETSALPNPGDADFHTGQEPPGTPPAGLAHRPRRRPRLPRAGAPQAGLAIAAIAALALALPLLSSSGGPSPAQRPATSTRSAAVSRPSRPVPARPAPVAPPSEAHPDASHEPRPGPSRHGRAAASEPKREPIPTEAPFGPPAPLPPPPPAEAGLASAAPRPSPVPTGGGPGAAEFGFER